VQDKSEIFKNAKKEQEDEDEVEAIMEWSQSANER
jgi:hypothetical protein